MRLRVLLAVSVLLLAIGGILFLRSSRPTLPSPQPDKERQLREVLSTLRSGLRAHQRAHGSYPASIEDLLRSGGLTSMPVDPITRSPQGWKLIRESRVTSDDFAAPSSSAESPLPTPPDAPIVDIRSGAAGVDSKGTPWSEY